MTDAQVSNARRIGFTAAALVAFWVLAWRTYDIVVSWFYDRLGVTYQPQLEDLFVEYPWCVLVALCIATVPTAFISLSAHNSLLRIRDRFVVVSGLLCAFTIWLCMWVGATDVAAGIDSIAPEGGTFDELRPVGVQAQSQHHVSRLWLLLPLILTTAFVIFGAWRRAVRDAACLLGNKRRRWWEGD